MGILGLDDAGGSAESGAVAGLLHRQHFLIALLQLVPDRLIESLHIGLGNDALVHELLFVNPAEGRARGDFPRDDGLGEGRLVRLVVALASVTIHVDDDVPGEFLAELEREKRGPVKFHRFLAVDVHDRRFDHFGDIRGIGRGAGVGRHRGEANLIVDDDVDGAAGAVTGELREVEHLRDRALPREGGVAMQQDRQHLPAVDFPATLAQHPLPRAGLALDDRVDGLEVAWIGRETHADFAIRQLADAFIAEVVFHVAVTGHQIGFVVRRELMEHGGERLADEVGEHVHAPAVGHAHFDLKHAMRRAGFEQHVEQDHGSLAALVGKPLFAEEAFAEKIFESLGFEHPAQRVELALR